MVAPDECAEGSLMACRCKVAFGRPKRCGWCRGYDQERYDQTHRRMLGILRTRFRRNNSRYQEQIETIQIGRATVIRVNAFYMPSMAGAGLSLYAD